MMYFSLFLAVATSISIYHGFIYPTIIPFYGCAWKYAMPLYGPCVAVQKNWRTIKMYQNVGSCGKPNNTMIVDAINI